ncbi:acetylornithine deacetylase [Cucumibacter marinus]|uniref:acetylornithine deacetylase n=1 Tax=Cucumibacter marinus TaxID=1121252 RepID=UPI00040D5608|nr:acetylornithine deacetylase [Cucumibacter marinus]
MIHRLTQSALDRLSSLIAYPTVSADSNLGLITDVEAELKALGAHTELSHDETGQKANLFATLGPADADGGIVLSGHTDVVPVEGQDWSSDPFSAQMRDGLLFGRGSCDMKGFIACALVLAPEFADRSLTRPLHFAFTYDEEVGCLGAQVMLDHLKATGRRPATCIIGEPTSMRIIKGHKGCCEYTTRFTGLEGHGSEPDKGVNAVEYAVRYVHKLMETAENLKRRAPADSPFNPPWTTIQIGRMAGGIARNVIAGQCEVDWEMRPVNQADFRFVSEQIEDFVIRELLPRMRSVHPEATIITEVLGEVAGLEPMTRSEAIELCAALTGSNEEPECVSFGTEAGLFQQMGISTVLCGPGSIEQAHKPNEFVSVDQISQCLEMIENLEPHLMRAT